MVVTMPGKYKVFFFFLLLALNGHMTSHNAQAQNLQDDVFLGLGVAYAERIDVLGIQGNLAFMVRDDARVSADFTHFFTYDRELLALNNLFQYQQTSWEINFNGHYYLLNTENMAFYALIGLHYGRITNEISASELLGLQPNQIPGFPSDETGMGANIGGGIEFILNTMGIYIEPKYTFGGTNQLSVAAGFRARF